MGFFDLHVHLLPGVDDGAQTMEDSLAMARALTSLGFTAAAPSPHHRPQYPSYSRALCAAKLDEVRAELKAQAIALELTLGAENDFLEAGLFSELGTPRARLIGSSKVLLVEAPYAGPLPALTDLVFRVRLKGVIPVIAHPERCLEFEKRGRAAEAVRCGAHLQLDLGSLIGRHGKPAQKIARELLGEGLYSVAATDAHSAANLEEWVSESLTALHRAMGPKAVTHLLDSGPRGLLDGTL